jgi:hypothetical protein
VVETTWPQIHPNCHLPSLKWLDTVADEGLHPSARLIAAARRCRAEVVVCECIAKPHRTPI